MGVVNVTPDSFSDGGLFLDEHAAIDHGVELVEQGAHIVDVGGESTRPGAEPVGVEEELRRVVPVVRGLSQRVGTTQISIDTSKAAVAQAAVGAGATLVNDVSALRADPEMAGVVAASGADCCLMHMLGEPRTMQRGVGRSSYTDVVDEVKAFLEERMAFAVGEGIAEARILLDPGIGFGKTVAHNLELLRRLDELVALGRLIVIGTSRKSFLGRISEGSSHAAGPLTSEQRLPGTIATNVMALERGASVFRVHDVAPVAAALEVASATLSGKWTASPTTS
ncbi:MAG TPA: dihydropteroate synthase [Solirubrobacteraceae bacterium]|jgi:dihydropteroate synthase|nr:dihydropteroate synthase [Solirubrobacteraceae bacterium]